MKMPAKIGCKKSLEQGTNKEIDSLCPQRKLPKWNRDHPSRWHSCGFECCHSARDVDKVFHWGRASGHSGHSV